jgi:hypothetical protein
MGIGILWVTMRRFFFKGGKKSENFIHTQKKSHTNMKSNDDVGLLVAKSRESTPGPILMSDREPHTDTAT